MTQTDQELARKIVQHLDDGVAHLAPRIRERLLAARKAALSHYPEQPVPALELAWVAHAVTQIRDHRFFGTRHWVAATTLLLALAGFAYWQSLGPANELADIDVGLLTDELPLNAYLDKGFDSWLKRASR